MNILQSTETCLHARASPHPNRSLFFPNVENHISSKKAFLEVVPTYHPGYHISSMQATTKVVPSRHQGHQFHQRKLLSLEVVPTHHPGWEALKARGPEKERSNVTFLLEIC